MTGRILVVDRDVVVTRFLAADNAAAASTGFSLKPFAICIRDATVFVEPRKNLTSKVIDERR